MFDCNAFLLRKNWRQKDLALKLGSSVSKIGMWCTGKSFPYYSDIVKLIDLGITMEELFGAEVAGKINFESNNKSGSPFNSPEFQKGVKEALLSVLSSHER